MPTENHAKVRVLLKTGKAKVVKRTPFTIQLLYDAGNDVDHVTLGIDTGSKIIGLSATTESKVLFECEVNLRNNIVNLIATRKELRRARRHRKLRYRKTRFSNRKKNIKILPAHKEKIETHLTSIKKVCAILPVSKIIIEIASFDIQKIKNPKITNEEYQKGEQYEFWNVREYVLWRDGHVCQICKGKSKDRILNVHHLETRKTGGDAPNNLITLCETCHKLLHKEKMILNIKRGTKFSDATFMNVANKEIYSKAKELFDNVEATYGYITKNTRITNGLSKTHYVDARCISGNPLAKPCETVYVATKIRCHNRQIHNLTIRKNGIRRLNQTGKLVNGFKLYDKVLYSGVECYIKSRRMTGIFTLGLLNGKQTKKKEVTSKKLKLLERQQGFILDRMKEVSC